MNDLQLESGPMEEQYENRYNEAYVKSQKYKQDYHLLKSKTIFNLDYIDLKPYYELGFRRRLMIRNVTAVEQKLGYNLDT